MRFSPQRRAIFRHQNFKKCPETLSVLNVLTCECASHHSGAQFFDIRTSKSAPGMRCFVHFDLWMCFSPQQRAFFRHQNFKKCSGHAVFCAFWLQHALFATAGRGAIFRHPNFKKCSRYGQFFTFWLGNVHFATQRRAKFDFFLSPHDSAPAALTGLLFDWPDTRIIEKNTACCDFSNIWRGCIFFLLTFALWHLLSADLTTLLCFSTVHIVGS